MSDRGDFYVGYLPLPGGLGRFLRILVPVLLVAAGGVAGALAAHFVGGLMEHWLFGVSASDPVALTSAALTWVLLVHVRPQEPARHPAREQAAPAPAAS